MILDCIFLVYFVVMRGKLLLSSRRTVTCRERGWHSQLTRSTHTLTSRTHWFSSHPPPPWLHLNNTVITRCIKFFTEIRDRIFICSIAHRMKTLKWCRVWSKSLGGENSPEASEEATQQTPPEMIQHPALDHLQGAPCQPLKDPESPEDLSQNKTPGAPMMTSLGQWRTISSRCGWS